MAKKNWFAQGSDLHNLMGYDYPLAGDFSPEKWPVVSEWHFWHPEWKSSWIHGFLTFQSLSTCLSPFSWLAYWTHRCDSNPLSQVFGILRNFASVPNATYNKGGIFHVIRALCMIMEGPWMLIEQAVVLILHLHVFKGGITLVYGT